MVKEVVRIPAYSEVVIRGFVDIQDKNRKWLFEPAEVTGIRVAQALVKIHEGKIPVKIINVTSVEKLLHKRMELGQLGTRNRERETLIAAI